ncbi:MAG TPA: phage tail protein, partial [Chloroflexota bacterium]|nr:phage tail protein [Chloroflexota bacterium]
FIINKLGQVVINKGVTTFITPNADLDAGWSSIRRVRTRDNLLNRIDLAWAPLIPLDLPNTKTGQDRFRDVAQGIVNAMIAEDALSAGNVSLDPARPPAGQYAYFAVETDDNESIAILLLTAQFRFAAPAA